MEIVRRDAGGLFVERLTEEYVLAFRLLDKGYPLPIDLEMALHEQGYSLTHLYSVFDL